MTRILLLGLVVFYSFISSGITSNLATVPPIVNIGVLFFFNSTIGKVVKVAVDAAVEDVTSDPSILCGTKLKLTMQDTNSQQISGHA
ncbi:hypothetical protein Patl1_29288 [Pistacia atlantica]|uniref:Uncharacterized protein n=1 Tax=Pistacia atlantica TaxID=434234 RepID=A0ACC1BDM6_9ROSI|nr:hypothetical protein Patl1_29288 [Pistacia atlantica]